MSSESYYSNSNLKIEDVSFNNINVHYQNNQYESFVDENISIDVNKSHNISDLIQLDGNIYSPIDSQSEVDENISIDINMNHNISDLIQLDGNISSPIDSQSDNSSESKDTIYDTDDEVSITVAPVDLIPIENQTIVPGQPIKMKVNMSNNYQSTVLPFCIMLNARSLYNKRDHFKDLYQLGPDCIIVSETWERTKETLDEIIGSDKYKVISFCRNINTVPKTIGGGSAIIYNESRFTVEKIDLDVPTGVEGVWALFTPKVSTAMYKVKRVAIGSF